MPLCLPVYMQVYLHPVIIFLYNFFVEIVGLSNTCSDYNHMHTSRACLKFSKYLNYAWHMHVIAMWNIVCMIVYAWNTNMSANGGLTIMLLYKFG